jgi:hypothetical protein
VEAKTPVLVVVLVESARLRWLVAAIGLDGSLTPLLRSEDDNLSTYRGLPFEEQVSFLRHRFCNILQRGCDRLWPIGKKSCQFVILFDGLMPDATEELIPAVSEHFVMWMLNPPVVVFSGGATSALKPLAGTIEPSREGVLQRSLESLVSAATHDELWELSQQKPTWQPSSTSS